MMFSASEHGREYALRETFEAIHTGHMLGAKRYVYHGRNRMLGAARRAIRAGECVINGGARAKAGRD